MTGLWWFAYLALPLIIVALGFGALKLNDRSAREDKLHPGE